MVAAIVDRGEYPDLPPLISVVNYPILKPNGKIFDDTGYDVDTGIYMFPNRPTPVYTSVAKAKEMLLDVICDFPLNDVGKSAAISLLLTILARPAIDGPCPLFLVDGNVAGAGKGLIVNVMSTIATGRESSVLVHMTNEDEERKRITAMLEKGPALARIDNIRGTLGSGAFDALLTSTIWEDRRLGKTEVMTLPAQTVWCATGNNVQIDGDTTRRTIHCRMVSDVEKPENRDDFKHPHLLRYCRQERTKLIGAALTILKDFYKAGAPDQKLRTMGSFESWSEVVRNSMVWAGFVDPAESRSTLSATDSKNDAFGMLLAEDGLPFIIAKAGQDIKDGQRGITAGKLVTALEMTPPTEYAELREALSILVGPRLSPRTIGRALSRLRDRVKDGRRLRSISVHNHNNAWVVEDKTD